MRCACIDVGSNTTRLLVAESIPGGLRGLHNERVFTLIGRSVADDGRIPAEKIEETASAVAGQVERARKLGATAIRVVATAAIRRASNPAELADALERRAAIRMEVLTGEEEAQLAYRGAAHVLGGTGTLAVVDVGGGSTEIAFGDAAGRIEHATSVPVGSSTLAERHFADDPPGPEQIESARSEVVEAFRGFEPRAADRVVAVGGSASSLLYLAGGELGEPQLAAALELLRGEPVSVIAARFELDPERFRLMPAGVLVLTELAGRFGRPLRICRGGLREGVVLGMMGTPE